MTLERVLAADGGGADGFRGLEATEPVAGVPRVDLRLHPVLASGVYTFVPHLGTKKMVATIDDSNARANTDFTIWIDSAGPAGTEGKFQVTYAAVTPVAGGWAASKVLAHTGVNVTVNTLIERLAANVVRKTIMLTADADTTVRLRHAYGELAGDAQLRPVSDSAYNPGNMKNDNPHPVIGWCRTIDPSRTIAVGMIAGDLFAAGVNRQSTATDNLLAQFNAGFQVVAMNLGSSTAGAKQLALTAGVPVALTITFVAAPFNQNDVTVWQRAVCDAMGLAVGERGDYFKRCMRGTAVAKVGRTNDNDPLIACIPGGYGGFTFIRDAFWTSVGMANPDYSEKILARFAGAISSNRVPTAYQIASDTAAITTISKTDESNMLFLCWVWLHKTRNGNETPPVTGTQRNNAYTGIASNCDGNGRWQGTGAGSGGLGWLDSYVPEYTNFTSALLQGMTYVAIRAAELLGTSVNATLKANAKQRYIDFYSGGYLRFLYDRDGATYIGHISVDALAPEFWSQFLFGESILSDAQVGGHLDRLFEANLVSVNGGRAFKNIVTSAGAYLPTNRWANVASPELNEPGIYQNGGSWLLHDFTALAAGRYHGYTNNDLDAMWSDRRRAEFGTRPVSHEFLATQAYVGSPAYAKGGSHVLTDGYGWNTLAAIVEDIVGLKYVPL